MELLKYFLLISVLIFSISCENGAEEYLAFESNGDSPPSAVQRTTESKKNIKTGNIQFESADVREDYEIISGLLKKHEAYIEKEDQSKTAYRINHDLIIRVSPVNFDNLIEEIGGLGINLDSKSISIADVTEGYYDLKVRIKTEPLCTKKCIGSFNWCKNEILTLL